MVKGTIAQDHVQSSYDCLFRYGYMKLMLRQAKKLGKIPESSKVQVFYDIACKFLRHLEVGYGSFIQICMWLFYKQGV